MQTIPLIWLILFVIIALIILCSAMYMIIHAAIKDALRELKAEERREAARSHPQAKDE